MRFTKIKIANESVEIDYQTSNKANTFDQTSIVANEAPAPEFKKALQALAPDLVDLCELPAEAVSVIEVRSIKLSYHGDHNRMGVVVSGVKILKHSAGVMAINAPLRLAPNGGKANAKRDASGDMIKKVKALGKHAEKFLKGHRQQTEMKL